MSTSDRNLYFEAASGARSSWPSQPPVTRRPLAIEVRPPVVHHPRASARYGLRAVRVAQSPSPLADGLTYVNGGQPAELLMHATLAPEVTALTAAVLVAWIGRLHQGKRRNLEIRIKETEEQRDEADETIGAMQESLASLRTRQDRIDISLSLWRELAARLERGDAAEAAPPPRAVLHSAGASAGIVPLGGTRLYPLAWRGQWAEAQDGRATSCTDCTALAASWPAARFLPLSSRSPP